MKLHVLLAACLLCKLVSPLNVHAQRVEIPSTIVTTDDENNRYPFRMADWIWTQPEFSWTINDQLRKQMEIDIRLHQAAQTAANPAEKQDLDDLEAKVARRLAERFCARDINRDLPTANNASEKTALCLVLDPKFTPEARKTISRAAELFLAVATDEDVIKSAFEDSIDNPTPIPAKFELDDSGKPKLDSYGNPIYSNPYDRMLQARNRPLGVQHFRAQLLESLNSESRDPTPLVVSSYEGDKYKNKWWGGGYLGFYHSPSARLQREAPARGYFYIRLSEDRLKSGVPHHDDPAFWAGKMAHEMLHNLWYRHPDYTDPEMRDTHNPPGKRAFIYAFELAVAEAAAKKLSK